MDLFLIRHGETDANAQAIIQGWLDTTLNTNGIEQASRAAASFDEAIDAIYSSDSKRSTQTAAPFRKKFRNIPYFEDTRLRERNFGDVTGKPWREVDADAFWSWPHDLPPVPGAESLDEFNRRVQDFLSAVSKSGYQKILVVTHNGTINRILDLVHREKHKEHENAKILHVSLPPSSI